MTFEKTLELLGAPFTIGDIVWLSDHYYPEDNLDGREDKWYAIEEPFTIVCGSNAFANKLRNCLLNYSSYLKNVPKIDYWWSVKANKPIGEINQNIYFCQHMGDGETSGGKKFEICITPSGTPLVIYGNYTFILTWDDITRLAERAGLFDKNPEDPLPIQKKVKGDSAK